MSFQFAFIRPLTSDLCYPAILSAVALAEVEALAKDGPLLARHSAAKEGPLGVFNLELGTWNAAQRLESATGAKIYVCQQRPRGPMKRAGRDIDILEMKNRLRRELPRLRDEYAVKGLGLFGSYVRGEQKRGSDVDVVVEFSKVPGMFRFLELERELSRQLQHHVDLVQKDTLKPAIGKRILAEVQRV